MNPILGWALAALVVAAAWQTYGWQGVAFAVSLVVFWLVLQFNRSIRVMKNASNAPVGHVPNAVMFNAKLKQGVTLLQVITLTKSLGQKVSVEPERLRGNPTWPLIPRKRSHSALQMLAIARAMAALGALIGAVCGVCAATPDCPSASETWRWTDEGGSSVTLVFDDKGRLTSWTLDRPVEDSPAP